MNRLPSPDHSEATATKPAWWRRGFWAFPLLGLASLVWFLIRVIPKPSRAQYPCQRVAMPMASGFIAWLLGMVATTVAIRSVVRHGRRMRWAAAGLSLLLGVGLALFTAAHLPGPNGQATMLGYLVQPNIRVGAVTYFTPSDPANTPMGVGQGVHPGRVSWGYDPNANSGEVKWDKSTGFYWDDDHNNQAAIDALMERTILMLSGEATPQAAWDTLFRAHNVAKGRGNIGYQSGEKIAIKVNLNNAIDWTFAGISNDNYAVANPEMYSLTHDADNESDATPQSVIALLRQLIDKGGVPANCIYISDSIRYWTDKYWTRFAAAGLTGPNGVHFVDCIGLQGREVATATTDPVIFYSDYGNPIHNGDNLDPSSRIPLCFANATYMVNYAIFKVNAWGLTTCGKNHFGSLCRTPAYAHWYVVPRLGVQAPVYGRANAFVDYMASKYLGQKTFLYLLDGLWGGWWSYGVQSMPHKWHIAPFGDGAVDGQTDWPSSFFASQDPVAIDSVALDFFNAEDHAVPLTGRVNYPPLPAATDSYLHEGALNPNPPSGVVYRPDGVPYLRSLGVHEHWNNPIDKQYTRNLGTGTGIELVNTWQVDPPRQPDLWVRSSGTSAFVGNDITNLTGDGQTSSVSIARGNTATFVFTLENDGSVVDALTLTGPASNTAWSVRYYAAGNVEITNQVTDIGWTTAALAPGASVTVTAKVTGSSTLPIGSSRTLLVTAGSANKTTMQDTAKVVVTLLAPYQLDLAIRNTVESAYLGDNVFVTDGAGQTKTQTVANNVVATYVFRLQNDGCLTDTFKVTANGAATGWTVRYYDGATGAEITGQVTGGGWTVGPVAKGSIRYASVKVTPTSAVAGTTRTLTIQATSLGDATKVDVAKAVTTVAAVTKPDLLVRLSTETTYLGNNVYNLDGAGQTKSKTVARGTVVTYYFRIQNDGNLADDLILTAPAGTAAWTVTYIDNATGASITSAITGAGWHTGALAPGAVKGFRVTVKAASNAPPGAAFPATVTAVSGVNTGAKDVVKGVTTAL